MIGLFPPTLLFLALVVMYLVGDEILWRGAEVHCLQFERTLTGKDIKRNMGYEYEE